MTGVCPLAWLIFDTLRQELSWTHYLPTEKKLAAEVRRERRPIEVERRLREGGADD